MTRHVTILLLLLVSNGFPVFRVDAQTSSAPSNAGSQNLAPQNLQGGSQIQSPGFSVPANVTTSQTTVGLNPSTPGPSASRSTPTFISAGRGLPGMTGGPPLGSIDGAFDRTGDYMTPTVVGPLFCDPAVNISC
ncbi:MAG: hypothetical protein AB7R40_12300 [Nitrospiraceae bacterium]